LDGKKKENTRRKEEEDRGTEEKRKKKRKEKKEGFGPLLVLTLSLCYQHEREEKKIRKDGGIWVCENQRVGAMFYRKGREANILQTCISSFRNLSYVIFNLS